MDQLGLHQRRRCELTYSASDAGLETTGNTLRAGLAEQGSSVAAGREPGGGSVDPIAAGFVWHGDGGDA